MRKHFLALFAALTALVMSLSVPVSRAQTTSNTVTVTVVAAPSCSITITPASYYQSKAATMTFNITSCTVASSSCTATWDTTNLPLTFTAGPPASLTGAVSATMTANLGNHSVVLTCPTPLLSMLSPVTLPNGKVGTSYTANLATLGNLSGGIPPYSFSLSSGSLPTGLTLSSGGVVAGTPSGAGSFNFGFTVTDASGTARSFRVTSQVSS